jgi:hypothetical protein
MRRISERELYGQPLDPADVRVCLIQIAGTLRSIAATIDHIHPDPPGVFGLVKLVDRTVELILARLRKHLQ